MIATSIGTYLRYYVEDPSGGTGTRPLNPWYTLSDHPNGKKSDGD